MPMAERVVWVPLEETDIPQVDAIATHIHPTLPERPEVFAEKVRLFPEGCFKLVYENRIAGYGVSHPWKLEHVRKPSPRR